jgi:hypothetical protein
MTRFIGRLGNLVDGSAFVERRVSSQLGPCRSAGPIRLSQRSASIAELRGRDRLYDCGYRGGRLDLGLCAARPAPLPEEDRGQRANDEIGSEDDQRRCVLLPSK